VGYNFVIDDTQDSSGPAFLIQYGTGRVGIGDNTPEVALDVVGDINYTGIILDVSDERLKENIAPVQNALDKLRQLRGVYFNMKDAPGQREVGLIAQDVQGVLPEAVRVVEPEGGYLGVSYSSVVPLLVEALKEIQNEGTAADAGLAAGSSYEKLQQLVQEKDCEIGVLENEIEELRSQISSLKELEARMARLEARSLNHSGGGDNTP
jgi:hypothetical protein